MRPVVTAAISCESAALGLGGLSLSHLLAARAHAAEAKSPLNDKSVIFLFMHGGPSQFETFDPKMSAPDGIRSVTGEIPTRLPGITFGSTFSRLANLADRLAVVRSYVPGDGNHDAKPVVHRETLERQPRLVLFARGRHESPGDRHADQRLALSPCGRPGAQPAYARFGQLPVDRARSAAPTLLSCPAAAATCRRTCGSRSAATASTIAGALLAPARQLNRQLDATGAMEAMDRFEGQAFNVILRGVADAFDLSKEDPKTVARYDTAPLVNPDAISKKWNNHKKYADHARTLGKLLLLARRLCEAGCGFVTINTHFVWDMHADVNNAGCAEGMGYMGLPFDHAVSAFIEDLEARGLSDKVLLVCCGEIGRTPRVNKNGGRDHWANLGPLLLHGGGLKMGQVIGRSTANGGEPADDPVSDPQRDRYNHEHAVRCRRGAADARHLRRRGQGPHRGGADSAADGVKLRLRFRVTRNIRSGLAASWPVKPLVMLRAAQK